MNRLMAAPTKRGSKGPPRVTHNPLRSSRSITIMAICNLLVERFT